MNKDAEFDESVAKLINSLGLELFDAATAPTPSSPLSPSFGPTVTALLDRLFPFLLRYLSNEYDDTTSAMFPFLTQYLLLLKRGKGPVDGKVKALLEVVVVKMKYDAELEYLDDDEEEALFQDMRKVFFATLTAVA